MKKNLLNILITATLFISFSCEQEALEPITTAAPGGGTLSDYVSYSIDSVPGQQTNVYGRVVFWKDNLSRTLIQVSMYNTVSDTFHPAFFVEGAIGEESTMLTELYTIDGNKGELSTNKFFVISDTDYFDTITEMDMHINIYLSNTDDTIVSAGNLGVNASPVEQSN